MTELERLRAELVATEGERDRLRAEIVRVWKALAGLYALCMNANDGAFENGVTDNTGTIDEGDVRASEYLAHARRALKGATYD